MTGRNYLTRWAEDRLTEANIRIILLNATTIANDTDEAVLLDQEVLQDNGYASQSYVYSANSATFNSTINKIVAPDSTATFVADVDGDGYQVTNVVAWQGRGATSSKPIVAVDATTDQIVCTGHGLVDGDRAFVHSEGTLPGGLTIQRYWVNALSVDTIELHTNSALTAPANILNAGAGDLWLVHANGQMIDYWTYPLITLSPGSEQSFTVSIRYS